MNTILAEIKRRERDLCRALTDDGKAEVVVGFSNCRAPGWRVDRFGASLMAPSLPQLPAWCDTTIDHYLDRAFGSDRDLAF